MTPTIRPVRVVDALVGRAGELGWLEALLDRAADGEGCVAVVTGEAGIGKTALLDELARRAQDRGFAMGTGRCAVSESPPYWPWPRVLRTLGTAGEWVTTSTGGGRAALFAAAADLLEQASSERPVLIAIDDVQWADESALALGTFLTAAAAGLRIALVLGVRDDPAEMTAALHDALAALPADVLHLRLGGLDVGATGEVVRSIVGAAATPQLAEELHARTGGNPLFIQECARLLAGHPGQPAATVPDRVRQVITRRLARLSEPTYAVLAAAAVVDDFDADLLAELTAASADDVTGSLDEAGVARLAVADDDGFSFAHALIRETLLDTQPARRRAELHERAARALEARRERSSPARRAALAGQAAAHWARVPAGRPRAAQLAVEAARGAAAELAYDHAASLYRWAHELGDDSLDTLTELGEAQVLAGQLGDGRETLAAAAVRAAADRRGDALVRAVLAAGSGVGGYEVDVRDEQQIPLLRDGLSLLGDGDSTLRAAATARLALVDGSLRVEARAALADAAAATAVRLRDLAGQVAALAARCDILSGPDHVDDRLATTALMVELAQRHGDPVILLLARRHRLLALLERGQLALVDDEIAAYARTSDHLRLPLYSWIVPVWRGMRALMHGDRRRATEYCDEAEALGTAAGSANADTLAFTLRFAIGRAAGDTAFMEEHVARSLLIYEGYPAADGMAAVHYLLTDRADTARGLLRRRLAAGLASIPRDSEWLEALWNMGEVATAVGELDGVAAIHDALVPYEELWAVDGIGAACYGSVSHLLGQLSIALGRRDEARQWFDAALHLHRSAGAPALAEASATLLQSVSSTTSSSGAAVAAAAADVGVLTRDGPVWHVEWRGRATTVRHSKGVIDIARLLERPGQELHVLDLIAPTGTTHEGDAGPMLDEKAKQAYQRRLRDIDAELDEATDMADEARAARIEQERDMLVAEITRAYGLGGRARSAGDPVERARKAVGMRITTAVRAVAASDPDLARHLENSIVTGRYCTYRPETEITWRIGR